MLLPSSVPSLQLSHSNRFNSLDVVLQRGQWALQRHVAAVQVAVVPLGLHGHHVELLLELLDGAAHGLRDRSSRGEISGPAATRYRNVENLKHC